MTQPLAHTFRGREVGVTVEVGYDDEGYYFGVDGPDGELAQGVGINLPRLLAATYLHVDWSDRRLLQATCLLPARWHALNRPYDPEAQMIERALR